MSLRIDLPNELERRLEAEAKRQGLSTDALARILLEEQLTPEDQNGVSTQPRVLAKNLPVKDRRREAEWLKKHRDEYAGQWIALDGEKLISSGDDLKQVISTARRLGVPDALMMRVEPNDALPFAGSDYVLSAQFQPPREIWLARTGNKSRNYIAIRRPLHQLRGKS